jgi:hypothetical protein
MAEPNTHIISAPVGGNKVVTHTIANDTIVVIGNNSVSNLCCTMANSATENVQAASIAKVWFGSQGGTWLVYRSNSSVNTMVGAFTGSNYMPMDGSPLNILPTQNLSCFLVGSANGFLMMELHKVSVFS